MHATVKSSARGSWLPLAFAAKIIQRKLICWIDMLYCSCIISCMSRSKSAMSEVAEALIRVQAIASQALRDSDYAALEQVAGIARQLESILAGEVVEATAPKSPKVTDVSPKKPLLIKKNKRKRKTASAGTPSFYRAKSELVKVGISKVSKGTYEHRAPFEVAIRLSRELSKVSHSEELFRMDDFLPSLGKVKGREVPSYQAYLCLAWMRSEGIVVQHGRRGYTVPEPAKVEQAVQKKFEGLELHK